MSLVNALNITSGVKFDNTITAFKYHAHQPVASSSFGYNDEIRFQIQNLDIYSLPSESLIMVEGKIKANPAANNIRFVQNGVAFLFDECRYLLNNIEVDKTRNLGLSTLMKGLVSFSSHQVDVYENAGWHSFTEHVTEHFSVCIPLKLLLGFAEDYNRIIGTIRQELVLVRARNDRNALYSTTADEKSEVEITKMTWLLPVIEVADAVKISLLNTLNQDKAISVPFRSWDYFENPSLATTTSNTWTITSTSQLEKPRFVIVGFQTNRKNNYGKEYDKFDHVNVRDIKLYLNSEFYPYTNMNLNFTQRHVSFAYQSMATFRNSYYGKTNGNSYINVQDFITKYPLFVFDCRFQNDRLKNAAVDIRLEIQTSADIPANTACCCLIIHDRLVEYTPLTNIVRKL